eukprot:SAG31_NODE_3076_length_4709_cov_2.785033_4_plen_29_part_01
MMADPMNTTTKLWVIGAMNPSTHSGEHHK